MSYAPIGPELTMSPGESTTDAPRTVCRPNGKVRTTRGRPRSKSSSSPFAYSLIVHSHLCWDWVWQRPQQFVSRLARRHKVLFIETVSPDPNLSSPFARFRLAEQHPNVTVLRIQFPLWYWNDGMRVDSERRRLVLEYLRGPGSGQFDRPVQWFYDPMAVTAFAGHLDEIAIVYDCMDELSKFRCAPREIAVRERELLARADVVFAGGRRLYEAKRLLNDNCHFYGCGVDLEHFGQALKPRLTVPEDVASLKRPVLGYFGVVDERLDYALLARLADSNPDWSIAMVGPMMKVDSEEIPRRSNLHWLGQRPYSALPGYCRGFDVCLMPFALNPATEFINPTKALEYMAAGRPIVSSALKDVVRNFGAAVKIAHSHDDFEALCRRAVREPDAAAIRGGLELAARNSWESIVNRLEQHVAEAILSRKPLATSARQETVRAVA